MHKKNRFFLYVCVLVTCLFFSLPVWAGLKSQTKLDSLEGVSSVAEGSFGEKIFNDFTFLGESAIWMGPQRILYSKIATVLVYVLRAVGVVLLLIIIYSGITWMSAGGNTEKVTKAKQWLTNASIGVAVVGIAHLFVSVVMKLIFTS